MQGYDNDQVKWLENWHYNKTTPLWKKIIDVLRGKVKWEAK